MISLIALAVVTTTPFTPTPSTHSYMYFDEAIPLSIDYSMVAIYDEDGVPEIPSFVIHHDSSFTLSSVDADINSDGIVNVNDLLMVVGNWGPCS